MIRKPLPFAARLCKLRKAGGLSIPQLAEKAGLPRQTIHLLENGVREPSLATARTLAKALGVSLAEFE